MSTLDPDALAALEEQHRFLRRSLDDLERERQAGDLDDDDYRTLQADYAARAEKVAAAISDGKDRMAAARPAPSPLRWMAGVGAVLVVAVVAGVVLAQAVGRRDPGQAVTGVDPRTQTRQALADCLELGSELEVLEAIQCYDAVLAGAPDHPEALTYRGWFLALAGLPHDALPWLDRGVEADPSYADARAFRAVVRNQLCQLEGAQADLDALDALDPPPFIRQLTAGVRAEVEARLAGTAPPCVAPDPVEPGP